MKRTVTAIMAIAILLGIAPSAAAAESHTGWGWVATERSFQQPTQVRLRLADGTKLGTAECYGEGCTPVRVERIRSLGADAPVILTRANGRTWTGTANKTFVTKPPRGGQTIEFAGIEVREP